MERRKLELLAAWVAALVLSGGVTAGVLWCFAVVNRAVGIAP